MVRNVDVTETKLNSIINATTAQRIRLPTTINAFAFNPLRGTLTLINANLNVNMIKSNSSTSVLAAHNTLISRIMSAFAQRDSYLEIQYV